MSRSTCEAKLEIISAWRTPSRSWTRRRGRMPIRCFGLDPTRRAIFEELTRKGEQTVHALTEYAGVSQPAVSKHLTVLKRAKLVAHRREGRMTHYRARPDALGPMVDWLNGARGGPDATALLQLGRGRRGERVGVGGAVGVRAGTL